jgi:hypothetical protein
MTIGGVTLRQGDIVTTKGCHPRLTTGRLLLKRAMDTTGGIIVKNGGMVTAGSLLMSKLIWILPTV